MQKTMNKSTLIAILAGLIWLPACAPLPGPALFAALDHPTPINNVNVTITIDPLKTSVYCNQAAWECGNKSFVVANLVLNAGFVMGCSTVRWDDDGNVTDCQVYSSFDWDWIIEHELKHCEGYDDVIY